MDLWKFETNNEEKVNIHGLQCRYAYCSPLNTQIFEPLSCCTFSGAEGNLWCEHQFWQKKNNPLPIWLHLIRKCLLWKPILSECYYVELEEINPRTAHLMFFHYGKVLHQLINSFHINWHAMTPTSSEQATKSDAFPDAPRLSMGFFTNRQPCRPTVSAAPTDIPNLIPKWLYVMGIPGPPLLLWNSSIFTLGCSPTGCLSTLIPFLVPPPTWKKQGR